MRINKLKLCAFGPFKNEVIIDFEPINEKGFFLLTGPTGVGKTTIFDAICFALYGETSSSVSSVDKLAKIRSDFADSETPTYVDLDFSLGDNDFFIHREPAQISYSQRTKKEVSRSHQAYLKGKDVFIERASDVTKKVIELIGLNAKQFKQVVMLPQGEFVKFLTGSSDDKMEILRKVFDTLEASSLELAVNDDLTKIKEAICNKNTYLDMIGRNFRFLLADEAIDVSCLQALEIIEQMEKEISCEQKLISEQKAELEKYRLTYSEASKKYIDAKKINEDIDNLKSALQKIKILDDKKTLINDYRDYLKKYPDIMLIDMLEKSFEENSKKSDVLSEQLMTKQEEYIECDNKYIACQKRFTTLEELKPLMDKKKIMISEYNGYLDQFIKAKAINKEMGMLALRNEKLDNDCKKLVLENETLKEKYKNKVDKEKQKALYQEELQQVKGQLQTVEKTKKAFSLLIEKRKKLAQLQQHALESNKEYQSLLSIQLQINEQIINNKAYEIAINLKENMPCPVCGSIDHPRLATKPMDIKYDKTSIDNEVKELVNTCLDDRVLVSNMALEVKQVEESIVELLGGQGVEKLSYDSLCAKEQFLLQEEESVDKKITEIEEFLEENAKALVIQELNEDKIVTINKEINDNKLAIMKLSGQILNLDDLESEDYYKKQIIEYEQETNTFEKTYNELIANINKLAIKRSEYSSQIKNMQNNQEEMAQNNKEILIKIKEKKEVLQIDDYKKYLLSSENKKRYENEVENHDKEYHLQKATIISLQTATKDTIYQDLTALKEEISVLEKRVEDKQSYVSNLEAVNKQNEEMFKDYQKTYQSFTKEYEHYEMVNNLSQMLNGRVGNRVSIERYMIFNYFEQILYEANIKLLRMTNNRYQLSRKESKKGNASAGLDIDVYDYYTGKYRDVRTLSGGESFKSALCLALGLSEVIRNKASGIIIETIFIDEGFGSLDPESLDLALNTLNEMRLNGHVVGIISHVEELKQRIDAKVFVQSNNEGSYIKTITV